MAENIFDFTGKDSGDWKVLSINPVIGDTLEFVPFLSINSSSLNQKVDGVWSFKGVSSNLRYTEKSEKEQLVAIQEGLGRPQATFAAMIPIKKNDAWWNLAQDERRKIFENKSHHTEVGLKYLPAIARKLFHCRDFNQPFDFITWFEFAPNDANFFEDLVGALRATEEWKYVEREVDLRLVKN